MPDWDPAQYLRFADHRRRPALDLLARVPLEGPAAVADLGCGPGNVTVALAERWPRAQVTGLDSSVAMLATARAAHPGIAWVEADLAAWSPDAPLDLVYSNAALHWLDDHAALFPRLMQAVAPGGALAVQMPRNHAAPTHTAIVEAAGPWMDRLGPLIRANPVAEPAAYYDWLAPHARAIDIWETVYQHVLEGEDPVVEWTKGSALRPLLDALPEGDRAAYLAAYRARIAAAYPRRGDGRTLMAFRRLFIVAIR